MPDLSSFLSSSGFQSGLGLLGGLLARRDIRRGINNVNDLAAFNPFDAAIGGAGRFGFGDSGGFFQLDPILRGVQGGLGGVIPGLFAGGLADQLGPALGSGGGVAGAADAANTALGMSANPFFDRQTFANTAANVSGIGNVLAGNVAAGPVDTSGGAQAGLFGQGFANMLQSANTDDLVRARFEAANALAQPGEQLATNRFLDREFQLTGGATTGAGQRGGEFLQAQLAAQNQRLLDAQQLGITEAQRLGNLGIAQIGQGAGLLGQNLGFFNQNVQNALGAAGLSGQLEGQGFSQMLSALQNTQSAGTQRLSNMLNLFNAQQGAFSNALGLGIQGVGALTDIGQLGIGGILGLLNAEANRIGATGQHANAIAQLSDSSAGFLGGLF